jgi:hypothetical protein
MGENGKGSEIWRERHQLLRVERPSNAGVGSESC